MQRAFKAEAALVMVTRMTQTLGRRRPWLVAPLLLALAFCAPASEAISKPPAASDPITVRGVAFHQESSPSEWAPHLAPLGAKTTRIEVMWDLIEPQDNAIDWGAVGYYDAQVNAALAAGTTPIILFGYRVPAWARAWDHPLAPPADPAKFGEFARFLAERWRTVRGFEVWNEPNVPGFWGGRTPDPAYYARILTAAYNQIKQVSSARVIFGGIHPMWGEPYQDSRFLKQATTAGAKFDAVGVHPYAAYPSEYTVTLDRMRTVTKKPLVATEFGWSTCSIRPHCVTEEEQGRFIGEALKRMSGRVTDAIVYVLHDPADEDSITGRWGLLRWDWSEKPSYYTLQNWTGRSYATTVLGTSGLVSYWRLGESSGTTAVDSKDSNDGTFNGGFTLGKLGAIDGDSNTSVRLDGSSGYLSTPANPGGAQGTIEFWGYANDLGSRNGVVYTADDGTSTYSHQIGVLPDGSVRLYLLDGSVRRADTASGLIAANTWHHYALVWSDGGTADLYVDGTKRASVAIGSSWKGGDKLLFGHAAGGASGLTNPWQGRIDEAAVYNQALSATTIQQHYNSG